jgi:hypothetical protein
MCRSWWRTPVINEAKRMRQEDHEFEASLGYTLKKKKLFHVSIMKKIKEDDVIQYRGKDLR